MGRLPEFRKGERALEWRKNPNLVPFLSYNTGRARMDVQRNETISKIKLSGVPVKAKYYQIKSVSGFGANEKGENIITTNPSHLGSADFPYLGGFNPRKLIQELPVDNVIEGNMSIETAAQGLLDSITTHPEVVKITRIDIFVYLLDADKQELGYNILEMPIIETDENKWQSLVNLSDITGPAGTWDKSTEYNELTTTDKTLIGSINETLASLNEFKNGINTELKKVIEAKGVTVPENPTIADLISGINQLPNKN